MSSLQIRRTGLLAVAIAVGMTVGACGNDPPDRGVADAGPDAATAVDAPPDAAPPPSSLHVDDGVEAVTRWTFDDTPIGARAQVTLFVENGGTGPTEALAAEITGAGAERFAIDASRSTCTGETLAPGARCRLGLAFAPTATGDGTATLRITGAQLPLEVPLGGTARAALDGLTADVTSLDLGVVETNKTGQAQVVLTNKGADSITLSPRTTSLPFAVSGSCPTTLVAGGTCTLQVSLTPSRSGILTGTLTVPSSANTLTIPLRGVGARRITIDRSGAGTGRVTSLPLGIDCGTTCTGLFTGAVTFTAAPDTGNLFSGWDFLCGDSTACAVSANGGSIGLTATFQPPGSKRVDIHFAGDARGFVDVMDGDTGAFLVQCTGSCTAYAAPGEAIALFGFSPSEFTGWTGGCVSTSHDCSLGTVADDVAVTATFAPSDREVATVFPQRPVRGLAFTPDGDLVVGDSFGVTRLTLSGAVVWSTAIQGGAHDLSTDAAGHIYGSAAALGAGTPAGPGLFALSPAGELLWTRDIAVTPNVAFSFQSTVVASPDGTVIAARTATGVRVVDGSGADRFAIGFVADGLAVAPDDTVAIGTLSTIVPAQLDLVRFDATGAPLPTLSPLPGDQDASLAFDAQNAVCSLTTGGEVAVVSRIAPDLSVAFSSHEATHTGIAPAAGLAVDSAGNIVELRAEADSDPTGFRIEVFSPTGTQTFTRIKPPDEVFGTFVILENTLTPVALAADNHHRFAIAGDYNLGMPVIQVYANP